MAAFTIRESHLKRAPFGVVTENGPLEVSGKLYRAATLTEAAREASRRTTVLGSTCVPMPLDRMQGVTITGLGFVLSSSGCN